MVDNTMYKQLHDDESENEPQDDLEQIVISSDQMPPRPFCLLLPATIRGFGLHDKKWSECTRMPSLPRLELFKPRLFYC